MNNATSRNNCRFFKSRQLLFYTRHVLFCLPFILLSSCIALHGRDGRKWYYRTPIAIGARASIDTNTMVILPFNWEHYKSGPVSKDTKTVYMGLSPDDLKLLVKEHSVDYVHLYLPGCSGSVLEIKHFDSLARVGRRVMVVALSLKTYRQHSMLAKTTFARFPVLYLDGLNLPKFDMLRKIAFIRSACPACYKVYKDDLIDAYCLSLKDDTIKVVMYNEMSGL